MLGGIVGFNESSVELDEEPEDPPEGLVFAGLSEDIEGELPEDPLSAVETWLIAPGSSEEAIMFERRKNPMMANMNRM